jgi:hypothetical protein
MQNEGSGLTRLREKTSRDVLARGKGQSMKYFSIYCKSCRVCIPYPFKQNLKNVKYGLIGGTLHTLH